MNACLKKKIFAYLWPPRLKILRSSLYAKHISDYIILVEDTPPIIASQILHDVSVLGLSPV